MVPPILLLYICRFAASKLQVALVRASDFYGPGVKNAGLGEPVFRPLLKASGVYTCVGYAYFASGISLSRICGRFELLCSVASPGGSCCNGTGSGRSLRRSHKSSRLP